MRPLLNVVPTPEQLALFSHTKSGVVIIRGAAGSGKTTTALLKLRAVIAFYMYRRRRANSTVPVRILVLTYNRTLRGYIEELAKDQVAPSPLIDLSIQTFASWSVNSLGKPPILDDEEGGQVIFRLSKDIALPQDFLNTEIEYILGRYLPENIPAYISARRDGRGLMPRVERAMREAIIEKIIVPYTAYKARKGVNDWNDLAVKLATTKVYEYDIVVTDETQDFSANQIRAIMNQLSTDHSVTFVLDTAQRIYARGFTWQEAGITIRPEDSHRLAQNYRNTIQIARFAASMIAGVAIDDDATMPDFTSSTREGPIPKILVGRFKDQLKYIFNSVINGIDLTKESVAFLHPKGGGWFETLKNELQVHKLDYVEITRRSEWPQGSENIALSTIHSAKGLEFDHVFMIGLNGEVLTHGGESEDDQLLMLRRLIAMGIGRARTTVILGYLPSDKSILVDFFDPESYEEIVV